MATKLGRLVTYFKTLLPIKQNGWVTWSFEILWQIKIIFSPKMLLATKLDRVITYYGRLSLITPHDTSITWTCEVMWQIKYFISPLFTRRIAANLDTVLTSGRKFSKQTLKPSPISCYNYIHINVKTVKQFMLQKPEFLLPWKLS